MPCLAARPERGATRPSVHIRISNCLSTDVSTASDQMSTPITKTRLTSPRRHRNRNIRIHSGPSPLGNHHIPRTIQIVPSGIRTALCRRLRLVTQQLDLKSLFCTRSSGYARRNGRVGVERHEGCRGCGARIVCGGAGERGGGREGRGVDYFCAFGQWGGGE